MITVLGPIKYWACTLWLPACLPSWKRPAAQTLAQAVQVAIFFPPGNYGRVSGITGLLADGNSAGVCSYTGSSCLHIWWTTAIQRGARYHHSFPFPYGSSRECVKLFQNRYFSASIENIFSPNNFIDTPFMLFLVRPLLTTCCDEKLKCTQ